jgi:ABC-type Co2+ transport system permease subunit
MEDVMTLSRMVILGALILVLLITVGLLSFGAYLQHNGLFEVGAELVKFVFGTVVGALASAFSERGDQDGGPARAKPGAAP